jgi:glycosyltransferase involved in cell wall biosynthesis
VKLTNKPLVSVILPVYNADRFLSLAIESILNQTYKNFELIAIDDGSRDNSLDILKKYAKKDKRIKIIHNQKNQNIANSLNKGIKIAKGQYIARMDADDQSLPNRIESQVKYLLKHQNIVILGGQCKTIDINNKIIGRKLFPVTNNRICEALYYENPIQHPTVIFNKKLIPKNFSWYNPTLPPAEDYDLFFRLAQFGKFHNLKKYVLKYRLYIGSETFKNPLNTFNITLKVRKLAITQYGYKPSFKGKIVHKLQKLTVLLLPRVLIYPTYLLIRGIKSPFQTVSNYFSNKNYFPNLSR